MAYDYKLLRVELENRIAWVTVDDAADQRHHAPAVRGARGVVERARGRPNLSVVVLKSADPDFFIAHFDVSAILRFPIDTPAERDPN